MAWGTKFIDQARRFQCRIVNHADGLREAKMVIGTSSFNVKQLRLTDFKKFVPALVKANTPDEMDDDDDDDVDLTTVMKIESWTDGTWYET